MDQIIATYIEFLEVLIGKLEGHTAGKLMGEESSVHALVLSQIIQGYDYSLEVPLHVNANGRALDVELSGNKHHYYIELKLQYGSRNLTKMGRIVNDLIKLKRHRVDHHNDNDHHLLFILGINSDIHQQINGGDHYQRYGGFFPDGDGWLENNVINIFTNGDIQFPEKALVQVHATILSEYYNTLTHCFPDNDPVPLSFRYKHIPHTQCPILSLSIYDVNGH